MPIAAALVFAAVTPAQHAPASVVRGSGAWRILRPPHDDDGIYIGITAGPDGAMWLTDERGALVRVDPAGDRTTVPLRFASGGISHTFLPAAIAVGADARFYLTGCVDVPTNCAAIGAADTHGHLAVYPIPGGGSARFSGIAPGPDGNIWFTDTRHVDRLTPRGSITDYAYPSGEHTNELSGIVAGADGNMWFTEVDTLDIGTIDPVSGKITEYSTTARHIDCGLSGMAAGPDGNLYAACGTGFIQVAPDGSMRLDTSFFTLSDGAQEIAAGADGLLWCQFLREVGRFDPARNLLTLFAPPDGALTLYGSATAPDHSQWTLAQNGTIYILSPAMPR